MIKSMHKRSDTPTTITITLFFTKNGVSPTVSFLLSGGITGLHLSVPCHLARLQSQSGDSAFLTSVQFTVSFLTGTGIGVGVGSGLGGGAGGFGGGGGGFGSTYGSGKGGIVCELSFSFGSGLYVFLSYRS